VRVDVAACLVRICHSQDSVSIALRWKSSHLSAPLITASLSKTKGIRPNRGDGKFTRPERASRCDNLNFLKRCPKLPVQARRHWQNSGPAEQFDGRYWPEAADPECPLFRRYERESRRDAGTAKRAFSTQAGTAKATIQGHSAAHLAWA
jgi:hypothetical protein